MNATFRWLFALVLAVTSAIFSVPAHAAPNNTLQAGCTSEPTLSSSPYELYTNGNVKEYFRTVPALTGHVIEIYYTGCDTRALLYGALTVQDDKSGKLTVTVGDISGSATRLSGTAIDRLKNPTIQLKNSSQTSWVIQIHFVVAGGSSSGSGGSSQNSSASSTSSTMPMIAESDPVLTKNATTVSCKLPAYQFYGKPQWAAYTLKVDGVSVSTTRTDATTMPLWVINDVADALDEKATLDAGTWAWNPAWQGKKLQCFVTAYGHHALGNTFSNVLS